MRIEHRQPEIAARRDSAAIPSVAATPTPASIAIDRVVFDLDFGLDVRM